MVFIGVWISQWVRECDTFRIFRCRREKTKELAPGSATKIEEGLTFLATTIVGMTAGGVNRQRLDFFLEREL